MSNRKQVTIDQFLTAEEFHRSVVLYKQLKNTGTFASTLAKEVIEPSLERINATLGQENDPKYLAYMVEYVLMKGEAIL